MSYIVVSLFPFLVTLFFFLVGKIWIFGEVFVEGKEEGREYNMNGSPAVHPKKRQRGRL